MRGRRRSTGTAGEHDVIGHRNGAREAPGAAPDLFSTLPTEPPPSAPSDRMRHPVRPPHASGSDTSLAAAEAMRGKPAAERREQVYRDIHAQGRFGSTRKEGTDRSGIAANVYTPRVLELIKHGRVVEGRDERGGGNVLRAGPFAPYCPGCHLGNHLMGSATCNRCNNPNATTGR